MYKGVFYRVHDGFIGTLDSNHFFAPYVSVGTHNKLLAGNAKGGKSKV
jgi:hypothetical protein